MLLFGLLVKDFIGFEPVSVSVTTCVLTVEMQGDRGMGCRLWHWFCGTEYSQSGTDNRRRTVGRCTKEVEQRDV